MGREPVEPDRPSSRPGRHVPRPFRELTVPGRVGGGRYFSAESAGARVLGLIVSAGVMAASGELGSVTAVVLSVLAAVTIYWVAESYAGALATHVSGPYGFWPMLRHELRLHWPTVEAALEPLVAMLVVFAAGATASVAITVGLATAAALLCLFGWVGATRGGLGGWRRVGATVMVASLGAAMIVLKTYLHSPRRH